MLMTMMLKAEDSIQIWADTISGLYCSLYWEMTSIRMNLKKNDDYIEGDDYVDDNKDVECDDNDVECDDHVDDNDVDGSIGK